MLFSIIVLLAIEYSQFLGKKNKNKNKNPGWSKKKAVHSPYIPFLPVTPKDILRRSRSVRIMKKKKNSKEGVFNERKRSIKNERYIDGIAK